MLSLYIYTHIVFTLPWGSVFKMLYAFFDFPMFHCSMRPPCGSSYDVICSCTPSLCGLILWWQTSFLTVVHIKQQERL